MPRTNGRPEPGSVWKHYNGGFYQVIAVARSEKQIASQFVVYQALQEPFEIWCRPLVEWYALVPPDKPGIAVPRYQLTGYELL